MASDVSDIPLEDLSDIDASVTCSSCQACCCQLEVLLISETGVPRRFIDTNEWGLEVMLRLDDGWCAALDRATYRCGIYEKRPWICRDFAMGSYDCVQQRITSTDPAVGFPD